MTVTMSKTDCNKIDVSCPFMLGETVYVSYNKKVYEGKVTRLSFYKDGNRVKSTVNVLTDNDFALVGEWGKNVFKTMQECKKL